MAAYLTMSEFQDRTTMPPEFITALDAARPGWIATQLTLASRWVDARLGKRYAVPFAVPVPDLVLGWVTRLVTFECWQRRGYDPADQSMVQAKQDADDAKAEVREAADSQDGLFDLPLRADIPGTSGISRKGPFSYSEQSPYVWISGQRATGTTEDGNGRGS